MASVDLIGSVDALQDEGLLLEPSAIRQPAPAGIGAARSVFAPADHLQSSLVDITAKGCSDLALVQLYQNMDTIHTNDNKQVLGEMQLEMKKIEEIREQENKIFKEREGLRKTITIWKNFCTFAEYCSYTASLAVGITTGGTTLGMFAVATGTVGLVKRFMQDTQGWEYLISYVSNKSETQQRYAQMADSTLLVATIGFGALSIVSGWGAIRAYSATIQGIMGITALVLNTVALSGRKYYESKELFQQSKLNKLQSDQKLSVINLSEKRRRFEGDAKSMQQISQLINNFISQPNIN